ncbi:hydrogenase maturation protease [Amycolatopsis sp. NPDC059657]|uniref:hydrogenase maturation protease n=1 Tax=Amycolatopsis sp. NPDC059657 TaxID=3346899 RepID=UPI00366FEEBA
MSTVVIGVGTEFRRDDGVGLVVAAELAKLPGVRVKTCDGEPSGLLDAWTGAELAIVVDAARGSSPGRIRRSTVDHLPAGGGAASSHAMGVPEAFRLGRALGRVPGRLVVFTVEAADLGVGPGLSEPVAAAVPAVVAAVLADLAATA